MRIAPPATSFQTRQSTPTTARKTTRWPTRQTEHSWVTAGDEPTSSASAHERQAAELPVSPLSPPRSPRHAIPPSSPPGRYRGLSLAAWSRSPLRHGVVPERGTRESPLVVKRRRRPGRTRSPVRSHRPPRRDGRGRRAPSPGSGERRRCGAGARRVYCSRPAPARALAGGGRSRPGCAGSGHRPDRGRGRSKSPRSPRGGAPAVHGRSPAGSASQDRPGRPRSDDRTRRAPPSSGPG